MRAVATALAILLALTCACGDVSAVAGRDLLSAIPADAAIVVSAIDFEDIRERARENHFVELFGGETWHDAKAAFNAAVQKGGAKGFDFPAAFAAVRGEAVFFFRFVGEDQKPEFGLLVEATPEDTGFVRLWEGLRGLAGEEEETPGFSPLNEIGILWLSGLLTSDSCQSRKKDLVSFNAGQAKGLNAIALASPTRRFQPLVKM